MSLVDLSDRDCFSRREIERIGKERIVLVLAKERIENIFWREVVVDRLKDVPLRYLIASGSVVFK
jgi:hypothetical protein